MFERKDSETKKPKSKPPRIWTTVGMTGDLDYFLENMSMLIGSGMSIVSVFDSVKKELETSRMQRMVDWMQEEIQAGASLSGTLEKTGLFRPHTTSLIHIGEQSGRLAKNIQLVSDQQKKDRSFRSKVKTALMYPVFVLSLTLIVGVGIAWFILPKLSTVFSQLQLELPLITQWLIQTGVFLSEYGNIVIPAFLVFVGLVIYFVFYFPATKVVGQTILFHLPGTNTLIRQVEIARFSYLLGTLLEAGLPVVKTIDSLVESSGFPQYRRFYEYLRESIENGNSFQKSFEGYKKINTLFPSPVQQMIVAGEQSGNLSESLSAINETYEEKIETTTKNLTVILEPILLVIVWLGVVAVALAVILPIYNLVGGLNGNPGTSTAAPTETSTEVPSDTSPTPTDTETATTTPQTDSTDPSDNSSEQTLEILPTGIGYLNVRAGPTTDTPVVGEVTPGDTFSYTDEEQGWFFITLPDGVRGWVYGDYVERIDE